jgi:nitrogen fixation protein NifB
VQCNFCNRKYDCVNESRPGVTSAVLHPEQAVAYLDRIMAREGRITTVGIAGPGDPFATPDLTLATLRLVKQRHPAMLLCVASNGLEMASHVDAMAKIGVTHCTITINAIDPAVAAKVYAWARPARFSLRGIAAGETIRDCQMEALSLLKMHGIAVKVNTIVIPGINDHHVGAIAHAVARWAWSG